MTPGLLQQVGPDGPLFAALLCGHALGDFVFQTSTMVERKKRLPGLALHVLVVALTHLALLAPWLGREALTAVAAIALAHALLDLGKGALARRGVGRPSWRFGLDQAGHLATLVLAALWLAAAAPAPRLPAVVPVASLTYALVVVTAYAFNVNGGGALVANVLRGLHLEEADDRATTQDEGGPVAEDPVTEDPVAEDPVAEDPDAPAAPAAAPAPASRARIGRLVGILERLLILTLVLGDQWGTVGLVLAAKSIARFKELDERQFSEYYLVGTLASVLTAVASGLAVRLLVGVPLP